MKKQSFTVENVTLKYINAGWTLELETNLGWQNLNLTAEELLSLERILDLKNKK